MAEPESQPRAASRCASERSLYEWWEQRATTGARLTTLDGRDVVVLSRGVRNDGAGPDYLDAVVIVAGRLAVGAVEMHRCESDWLLHGHDRDPAYEAVVLHVLGAAPVRQTLAIPSVLAALLGDGEPSTAEVPLAVSRAPSPSLEISRELLLEAAWGRLLRRAREVLRDGEAPSDVARLRRAFVVRLFDCLGYSANRRPMRALGERVVADGAFDGPSGQSGFGFDAIASRLFGLSGGDAETLRALGAGFMSETRIDRILSARPMAIDGLVWSRVTRPANAPERRLWGACRILTEIACTAKLERLLERIAAGAPWHQLERELVVRLGSEPFIGAGRAAEIVMNALLPVALAAGILTGSRPLIERACRLYRGAPAQESNRTIRLVERRFLAGRTLRGGFWQQGAIEHYQQYLSPDRSALRFLAEACAVYDVV